MQISFSNQSITDISTDALVVGLYATTQEKELALSGYAKKVDAATSGLITKVVESGDFTGRLKEVVTLYAVSGMRVERLLLVGLGKKSDFNEKSFIEVLSCAVKATKAKRLVLTASEWIPQGRDEAWAVRTAVRSATFHAVKPSNLKTDAAPIHLLEEVSWLTTGNVEALEESLHVGQVMGQAMLWARELADLPPNFCDPEFMAQAAMSLVETDEKGKAKKNGAVTCRVLGPKEIDEAGMGGLLAVSQGSAVPAAFIEVAYQGAEKDRAPVVLVGKGITFDAGGISLKPARNMDAMKFDMCGASVVLAAVKAASEMKLKENVVALVPCAENLPSGSALKPADVITMANGMTVEVLNTDAEGRLILADALTRACELEPAVCIDVATLTGACIVALGTDVSGLFCDDEALTDELAEAAESTTDAVWPMPMGGVYRKMLDSAVADIANACWTPNSGACTAATFLKEFAPQCPWAHLDVAGTANTTTGKKHSTARPLPLILEWLYLRSGVAANFANQQGAVKKSAKAKKA